MMDKTIRSSKTPKIVLLPGKQNKIKEKKMKKGFSTQTEGLRHNRFRFSLELHNNINQYILQGKRKKTTRQQQQQQQTAGWRKTSNAEDPRGAVVVEHHAR
jgi:hypothetical protein